MEEIRNRVAESGLVNLDIASLRPQGQRIGIDLRDYLFQGWVLKEKDFRNAVENLDIERFKDAYVHVYCSVEAVVPLWAWFLLSAKLAPVAREVMAGNRQDLEVRLWKEAVNRLDIQLYKDKRVLMKGCTEVEVPLDAYVALVARLGSVVKSLMFGEACSMVPILKN